MYNINIVKKHGGDTYEISFQDSNQYFSFIISMYIIGGNKMDNKIIRIILSSVAFLATTIIEEMNNK